MDEKEATYDLPEEIAAQLLCSICNLCISCGPVKIGPNGNSVCGRCSPLNCDNTYLQNTLYEACMSKFRFPCCYQSKGCNERLPFGKSIEHENACIYRTFICPSLPHNLCGKYVNGLDIYKHFEEDHRDLILTNGQIKLNLEEDSQQNFLMKHKEIIVIVQYNYIVKGKRLMFNTAYFSDYNQIKLSYKLQFINCLESDLAVNCRECVSYFYNSPILNEHNAIIFKMMDYLPALDTPGLIIIKLNIIDNQEGSMLINSSLQTPHQQSVASWDLLEKYRCTKCNVISIPPLFSQYQNGTDIICSNCNVGMRNRFEVQLNNVSFPCQWRKCNFIGNENNIREHITKCKFRTCICPVQFCETGYYLSSDVLSHMKKHGTYCADPKNIIIEFCTSDTDNAIYFTIWENILIVFSKVRRNYIQISSVENAFKGRVKAYFEHDHCLLRSKTLTYTNNNGFHIQIHGRSDLPSCFKDCKRMRGVFNITQL